MAKNIAIGILVAFSIVAALYGFVQQSIAEKNLELAIKNEQRGIEVEKRYSAELEECRNSK